MTGYMTCVCLSWSPRTRDAAGGWWAELHWHAGRLGKPGLVDGAIRTRYPASLRAAVGRVLRQADELGLVVHDNVDMALLVENDGQGEQLPAGWKDKVRREAARRGWVSYPVEAAED